MKITIALPNGKKREQIIDAPSIIIGRSKDCQVQVEEEALSRKHCRIEECDGNFYITDLGSTNGVHLDGNRIAPKTKILYETFLQLQIGPFECFLESTENETYHIKSEPALKESIANRQKAKTMTNTQTPNARLVSHNPKVKNKTDTKSKLGLYFSLLFLLVVIGYFVIELSKTDPDSASAPEESSAPAEVRDITVL